MIKYCKNKIFLTYWFLFQFIFHIIFFILQIQYDKFKSKVLLFDFNFFILMFGLAYNFLMIFDSIILYKMNEANYNDEISSLFLSILSEFLFSFYFSITISHSFCNTILYIFIIKEKIFGYKLKYIIYIIYIYIIYPLFLFLDLIFRKRFLLKVNNNENIIVILVFSIIHFIVNIIYFNSVKIIYHIIENIIVFILGILLYIFYDYFTFLRDEDSDEFVYNFYRNKIY